MLFLPRNLFKSTMLHRCLMIPIVFSPLGAQESSPVLTEAQAVSRALARPEWQALTQLPARQTEGASQEARSWLSPGVEWSRERFTGIQPGKREDTFLVTQGIDLSGRWLARRTAALKREEAGKAESSLREAGVAAQVREAFYDLMAARERTARVDRALNRLLKVQEQVDRLHAAGEMSGLDRGRVRREMELLKGRQVQESSNLTRAELHLSALLGGKVGSVQGELIPSELEPLDNLLAKQQTGPSAVMTRAQEAAAQADAKAARRWMPELTVGLGVKRWQENSLSGSGSVVSLGLTLPTLGRVKGSRTRIEAEARATGAQARLQREQEEAELRALWKEAADLRSSAERMSQEALTDPAKVESALDAAFAAGEMDLLARLDGSRSVLEAELTALEQANRARKACIALDRMLGKVNP